MTIKEEVTRVVLPPERLPAAAPLENEEDAIITGLDRVAVMQRGDWYHERVWETLKTEGTVRRKERIKEEDDREITEMGLDCNAIHFSAIKGVHHWTINSCSASIALL